jgi:hypothetical protein
VTDAASAVAPTGPTAGDGHETTRNIVATQPNYQIAIDLAKPNVGVERLL